MMRQAARIALIVLELFVGLSAVGGGIGLIWTNGLGMPLSWLSGAPFGSYLIPGILLTVVVGGANLLGAAAVLLRHKWAAPASAAAGSILVGWIAIQVAMIGFLHWLQPLYLALGLVTLALAAWLSFDEQRRPQAHLR